MAKRPQKRGSEASGSGQGPTGAAHQENGASDVDPNILSAQIREKFETIRFAIGQVGLWSTVCFIVFMARDMVVALAGHQTDAKFSLSFIASKHFVCGLMALVGGGGLWYGRSQRNLRRRNTQRDHERVAKLEKKIDPNRTAATLTAAGDRVRKAKS